MWRRFGYTRIQQQRRLPGDVSLYSIIEKREDTLRHHQERVTVFAVYVFGRPEISDMLIWLSSGGRRISSVY